MILAGIDIYAVNRLSEIQEGKPVSEALALKNKAVVEALDGLPAHKIHCSVLAEEAIKKALLSDNGLESRFKSEQLCRTLFFLLIFIIWEHEEKEVDK